MMKFRVNDELVCVVNGTWETVRERRILWLFRERRIEAGPGPKLHQVVTVVGYDASGYNVALKEFPADGRRRNLYHESCFERLDDINLAEVYKILKREPFT
jgi:hypothetical protein